MFQEDTVKKNFFLVKDLPKIPKWRKILNLELRNLNSFIHNMIHNMLNEEAKTGNDKEGF